MAERLISVGNLRWLFAETLVMINGKYGIEPVRLRPMDLRRNNARWKQSATTACLWYDVS